MIPASWKEWNDAVCSPENVGWLRASHKDAYVVLECLPELAEGIGVEQPPQHHIEDVFNHCVSTYEYAVSRGWKDVAWAALLHDTGKARTKKVSASGKITFHKHEVLSDKMAHGLLTRLGAPKEEVKRICGLVRNHMYHYTSDTWAIVDTNGVELEKTRCGSAEEALALQQMGEGFRVAQVHTGWKDAAVVRFANRVGIASLGENNLGEELSEFPLFRLRQADRGSRSLEPITKKQRQFEDRLRRVLSS